MKVFFTVDTEFHPLDGKWSKERAPIDLQRDIYGTTPTGDYGAIFQAELLREYGLKGVFFVEALSGYVAGCDALSPIVRQLQGDGHEVGLHLHPEWLRRAPCSSVLPGKQGQLMHSFSKDDQCTLIARGVEKLMACGVERVYSFRAGGYGANRDTLGALSSNGIPFDSSHNMCWLGITCNIETDNFIFQPTYLDGVFEFPVSCFQDWPGHWRHAQLCACSSGELQGALLSAWRNGWYAFVIVSHSFELIRRGEANQGPPWSADKVVLRRFKQLCEFLRTNQDKFQTSTFAELDASALPLNTGMRPLKSSLRRTTWRLMEQAYRRLCQ
jgi:hypothetical protein